MDEETGKLVLAVERLATKMSRLAEPLRHDGRIIRNEAQRGDKANAGRIRAAEKGIRRRIAEITKTAGRVLKLLEQR